MRKTHTLTAAALILTFLVATTPAQKKRRQPAKPQLVTTTYDRFSGRTTISALEIEPVRNLLMSATVSYVGPRPKRFDQVRVLFVGLHTFWPRIENEIRIGVEADKQLPISYTADYSSTFQVEGVLAISYGLDWSLEQLANVACARTVQMKVGHTEMKLQPKHVATLKAFLIELHGTCPNR